MMLVGFLLLLISGEVSCEENCSYQRVLDYLNLTRNNDLYTLTRPVKNYKNPTKVTLEVLIYAILDVVEKDQQFIPYVWTVMRWKNEYISWNPDEFCGINNVSLPTEMLWKPDLTIEEMTEKDKAPPSPYLTINNRGDVEVSDDQVLVSTCRMHIYRFPFDIQMCNLTFKSIVHTARDIRLQPSDNSSEATEWSKDVMRTQFEWLFINMLVTVNNATDLNDQDIVTYTIIMRRRAILYVVNFLLPVLFFLCLDLASFLISESCGEKLSYKVTVLLAITVLQLILNDILPSSSNRVPLIAVYCIGVFGLMMFSLLETILVMYLVEQNSTERTNDGDGCLIQESKKQSQSNFSSCHTEAHDWSQGAFVSNTSVVETPTELLPVRIEDNNKTTLERVSDELRAMEKTLTRHFRAKTKEEKRNYWIRLAKRVNKVFFFVYFLLSSVFLIVIFVEWNSSSERIQ